MNTTELDYMITLEDDRLFMPLPSITKDHSLIVKKEDLLHLLQPGASAHLTLYPCDYPDLHIETQITLPM